MNKVTRLAVEDAAREAAGTLFRCAPISQRVPFPNDGPIHEFDIYAAGELIGGVSTSPLKTSGGRWNTGGFDRACSELLWLSLWPGTERRIHILTDKPLAEKLVSRYRGVAFPHVISVYHYACQANSLSLMGTLWPSHSQQPTLKGAVELSR